MATCTYEAIMKITDSVQRAAFIHEVCDDGYGFINLVSLYFNELNQISFLMYILLGCLLPFCFLQVSVAADKFLAHGMNKLAHRFKLSPAMAAVTIVSFSNGAPDILATITNSGKEQGSSLSVVTLIGAFAFSATLVIGNVRFNSPGDVVLDKAPILKEFVFYLIALAIIVGFGIYGVINYWFVGIYAVLYIVYIVVSVKIDYTPKLLDELSEEEPEEEAAAGTLEDHKRGQTPNEGKNLTIISEKDSKKQSGGENLHISRSSIRNRTFGVAFASEVIDMEDGLVSCVMSAPLRTACLLFIPYSHNPFLYTKLKVFVYILGTFFIFNSFLGDNFQSDYLLIAAGVLGITIFLIDAAHAAPSFMGYITIFMTVFTSIGVMKLFIGLLVDCITFLAFYFVIDQVIMFGVLLSAGNTIADFFINGALSAQGESLMAGIASFSGQTFNFIVGMAASAFMMVRRGNTNFDIFGLKERHPNWFLGVLISFSVLIILLHLIYYLKQRFVLGKTFSLFLVICYGVFLSVGVVLGIASIKDRSINPSSD